MSICAAELPFADIEIKMDERKNGMEKELYFSRFTKPVRRIGKISLILAILCSFLPALYVSFSYGAYAPLHVVLGGWLLILSNQGTLYVVEPVSYYPTLGEAGTYMSFLSGNIMGIRVPACAASMDTVGAQPGTQRGEIVSAIAIAGSVISTVVFGVIAIFIGQGLLDSLPAPVLAGLGYILPASYGAIITGYVKKNPPVGIFGLILGLLLNSSSFIPRFARQILSVILCITFGILLFKRNEKNSAKK